MCMETDTTKGDLRTNERQSARRHEPGSQTTREAGTTTAGNRYTPAVVAYDLANDEPGQFGSARGTRTLDLLGMNQTSCRCSTAREIQIAATGPRRGRTAEAVRSAPHACALASAGPHDGQ